MRMLQLILLMGSARAPGFPSQRSTRPREPFPAGQGSSRQLPAQLGVPTPFPGAGMSGASLVPYVHTENNKQAGLTPGPEPAAKGMKEPIRLWLPLTSGRLAGATARIHLPRADLEPCSRAHRCLSERLRGSRPWCLCLTTALMEKLVGMRGVQGV